MGGHFPSERKIPLTYFFSIETIKNYNNFEKIKFQFQKLFRILLKFNVYIFHVGSCELHYFRPPPIFFFPLRSLELLTGSNVVGGKGNF